MCMGRVHPFTGSLSQLKVCGIDSILLMELHGSNFSAKKCKMISNLKSDWLSKHQHAQGVYLIPTRTLV